MTEKKTFTVEFVYPFYKIKQLNFELDINVGEFKIETHPTKLEMVYFVGLIIEKGELFDRTLCTNIVSTDRADFITQVLSLGTGGGGPTANVNIVSSIPLNTNTTIVGQPIQVDVTSIVPITGTVALSGQPINAVLVGQPIDVDIVSSVPLTTNSTIVSLPAVTVNQPIDTNVLSLPAVTVNQPVNTNIVSSVSLQNNQIPPPTSVPYAFSIANITDLAFGNGIYVFRVVGGGTVRFHTFTSNSITATPGHKVFTLQKNITSITGTAPVWAAISPFLEAAPVTGGMVINGGSNGFSAAFSTTYTQNVTPNNLVFASGSILRLFYMNTVAGDARFSMNWSEY